MGIVGVASQTYQMTSKAHPGRYRFIGIWSR